MWDPYKVKHITDIEDVQRRATKLIPEIKKLCYPERLKKLNLLTLACRLIRGQMIEVCKIINNIHDNKVLDKLLGFRKNVEFNLRGNDYTLEQITYKLGCKNFYSNKIVTTWTTLPNIVVKSASLNVFKNRFDKLW